MDPAVNRRLRAWVRGWNQLGIQRCHSDPTSFISYSMPALQQRLLGPKKVRCEAHFIPTDRFVSDRLRRIACTVALSSWYTRQSKTWGDIVKRWRSGQAIMYRENFGNLGRPFVNRIGDSCYPLIVFVRLDTQLPTSLADPCWPFSWSDTISIFRFTEPFKALWNFDVALYGGYCRTHVLSLADIALAR